VAADEMNEPQGSAPKVAQKPAPSLLRSAVVVGALTLISRLTGMLQSRLVAAYLGNGAAADAFFVAFRLPNLLRRFTAEGTMTAAFLPTVNEVAQKDGELAAKDAVAAFLGTLASLLALLCFAGMLGMGLITGLLMLGRVAPGLPFPQQLQALAQTFVGARTTPAEVELTALLGRIMFPYLLLVSLTAGLAAVLNLKDRFGLPASVSTFWNLSFMAFAWLSFKLGPKTWQDAKHASVVFAVAVIVGGLVQLLALWPSFVALGYRIRFGWHLSHPSVKLALQRMVPGILGAGVHPINALLSTFLASRLPVGSQSVLFNSNMMGEMVLGLFAVSIATVSLPTFSRLADQKDFHGLADTLGVALRGTAFLAIPGAIGMAVLAQPIIALIFQNGRFTAADVSWTAWTLSFQAVGLLFIAAGRVGAQALYALKDYRGPAQAALFSMVLNLLLSYVLMRYWGTGGIALANGLASIAGLIWIGARLAVRIRLPWLFISVGWILFGLASIPLALLAHQGAAWLGLFGAHQGLALTSMKLLPLIALCAALYFGALIAIGNREAKTLGEKVKKRLSKVSLR
jgi:putative peptidoglycan lipid II flippase